MWLFLRGREALLGMEEARFFFGKEYQGWSSVMDVADILDLLLWCILTLTSEREVAAVPRSASWVLGMYHQIISS